MSKMKYISTTVLCELVGYQLSVGKLKELGFEPTFETKTSAQWNISIVPCVCLAMISDLSETAIAIANNYTSIKKVVGK